MIADPHKKCWRKSSTLQTLMASHDSGAYNLMRGKVFLAMLTCPVMTISRRAEDSEIKTKVFCDVFMSRGDEFESEMKISRAR